MAELRLITLHERNQTLSPLIENSEFVTDVPVFKQYTNGGSDRNRKYSIMDNLLFYRVKCITDCSNVSVRSLYFQNT